MHFKMYFLSACAFVIANLGGIAGAQAGRYDHETCGSRRAESVLSVGDYDGNGVVNIQDVNNLINQTRLDNSYAAFFDRNADGALDFRDVEQVAKEQGAVSTLLDRQLASIYLSTVRYRDIKAAKADGFIPIIQGFEGRGTHWAKFSKSGFGSTFVLAQPTGLNYSENGRLLGVFYAMLANPQHLETPPDGFIGNELWYSHEQSCFRGVDLAHPSYDFSTLNYAESIAQTECKASVWLPKYWMTHAWLYDRNPCGTFADEDPNAGDEDGNGPEPYTRWGF